MLTEYALTPQIFDDEYNATDPGWFDRIRAFAARLLPVGLDRVCNTVISDLHGENWYGCGFAPLIDSLERRQKADPGTRLPALDLLKQLRHRVERLCVRRPACNDHLPQDEAEWVNEAIESASRSGLPIHRIVASSNFRGVPGVSDQLKLLEDTPAESFWDTVPVTQCLQADLIEQCKAIRRMCTFYTYLGFASPHIDTARGTDLDFAVEMVRTAFDRPAGYAPPARIDLHTKGLPEEGKRKLLAERVRDRLREKLGPQADVLRIYVWPTGLERHLLVGRALAYEKPAVVWAVSLTHVARPEMDGPKQDFATFSVLPASQTSQLASRYYSNPSTPPYECRCSRES